MAWQNAMKKWRVYVCESNYGWIELEAEDEAEAKVKAIESGDIRWNDGETEATACIEIDPETGKDIRHR